MSGSTGVRVEPGRQGRARITGRRYSAVAIVLHWLIAAAIAFQIGLGWRMDAPRSPQTFAVFQLHKSVGITILVLTLARLAWRLMFRPPPYPSTMRPAERLLAHAVHVGFYVLLLALPLSGWMIVSSSKVAVPTFLYGTIPWPHIPGIRGLEAAHKAAVNAGAVRTHLILVWLALAAILLHVAGALKHQFEQRDYLARMTPLPKGLTTAALLIICAFIGLMALGRNVHLKPVPIASREPPPALPVAPVPHPTVAPPPPSAAAAVVQPKPEAAEVEPEPVSAQPSAWVIRKTESALRFHTAWSQGPVDGGFASWRATILFDPDALARSSVRVTIDMGSVTAADSDQRSALPESDWFAVSAYPSATWTSNRIRHLAGNRYAADGTLSLRGVARPLPLTFTLDIDGNVATMHGTASIDRTIFGVGQGEWASTADLPALVTVAVEIKADRAKNPLPKNPPREKK